MKSKVGGVARQCNYTESFEWVCRLVDNFKQQRTKGFIPRALAPMGDVTSKALKWATLAEMAGLMKRLDSTVKYGRKSENFKCLPTMLRMSSEDIVRRITPEGIALTKESDKVFIDMDAVHPLQLADTKTADLLTFCTLMDRVGEVAKVRRSTAEVTGVKIKPRRIK